MTEEELKVRASGIDERLPRRDWILLACIFLGTIILLAGGTELVSRLIFSQSETGIGRCIVLNDGMTGARGIPNSVCYAKAPESENTELKFNSCGHRTELECGPKPARAFRIVMTGSSIAMADLVQERQGFGALLPDALSKKTRRWVQVYNESMGWGFTHSVALRFRDVLAAKPDLILWIVTPGDVDRSSLVLPTQEDIGPWSSKSHSERILLRLKTVLTSESGMAAIADLIGRSRTAMMLRHFLYQSQSLYVQAALARDDSSEDFLRYPMSTHWKEQLKEVDSDAATIEAQARDAGVPFVTAYLPDRAQAAMVSIGQWPTRIDPYQLDNELRPIIESHGGTYIDLLPEFRAISNPERYYFPVDGHPNPEGHAVLARILAKELTSGVVPALKVNVETSVGSGGGR